jgi:hypothetical protein
LKQRACRDFLLSPEATELWRNDPSAETTGSEALQDDMRVTDAAAQRLGKLLLEPKVGSRQQLLCM